MDYQRRGGNEPLDCVARSHLDQAVKPLVKPQGIDCVYSIDGLTSNARLIVVKRHSGRFDEGDFSRLGIAMTPELSRSVDRRKDDYLCGRYCSRLAMVLLGHTGVEVLNTATGRPVWPSGTFGSISHCNDYACSLVLSGSAGAQVGVDIETCVTVEKAAAVLRFSISKLEEPRIAGWSEQVGWLTLLTLLFSAKESAFKALSQDEQRAISMRDMHAVAFMPDGDSSGAIELQLAALRGEIVSVSYLLIGSASVMTWCGRGVGLPSMRPGSIRMKKLDEYSW